MTASAIMELESILNLIGIAGLAARQARAQPLKYFVWVFGRHRQKGTWGWKVKATTSR